MPDPKTLGERIKLRRLQKKLTLKDVELQAKVSATHISEIERGMSSPTVGALVRIARALDCGAADLLRSDGLPRVAVSRADARANWINQASGATFTSLAAPVGDGNLSMVKLALRPGESDTAVELFPGETFLYVLSGGIDLERAGTTVSLHTGDSVHMDGTARCRVTNRGAESAEAVLVTTPAGRW